MIDTNLLKAYEYGDLNQKDIIFCIVGDSGSGKSTVVHQLEKENPEYNVIHSYTTRKPRYKNEWGHIFINEYKAKYDNSGEVFKILEFEADGKQFKEDDLLACAKLYNDFYFATHEQYQGKGATFYVVDPSGALHVMDKAQNAEVITIYLKVDENNREKRLKKRYYLDTPSDLQSNDDCKKYINDRIVRDRDIFNTIKCDYVVDANVPLDIVVERVRKIVEKEMSK